jgi:hypothetical protein
MINGHHGEVQGGPGVHGQVHGRHGGVQDGSGFTGRYMDATGFRGGFGGTGRYMDVMEGFRVGLLIKW